MSIPGKVCSVTVYSVTVCDDTWAYDVGRTRSGLFGVRNEADTVDRKGLASYK